LRQAGSKYHLLVDRGEVPAGGGQHPDVQLLEQLLTRKDLPVAGMPMNSPWWVPLTLVKALTRSLSATISSVVNRRSGKVPISIVISFLNPARPAVNSGGRVGSLSAGQW
jgi:hypothetical protein